jgi:putative transposase
MLGVKKIIDQNLKANYMKLHSHFHCVFDLKYHLVLVTKYRRKCFTDEILQYLETVVQDICKKWDVDLIEFGGEADHIHILFAAYPNIDLSKFINNLKTVSSRLIRKKYQEHLSKFYWKPVLWTRAYCLLSSGGAPIDVIKQYIQNQGQ